MLLLKDTPQITVTTTTKKYLSSFVIITSTQTFVCTANKGQTVYVIFSVKSAALMTCLLLNYFPQVTFNPNNHHWSAMEKCSSDSRQFTAEISPSLLNLIPG